MKHHNSKYTIYIPKNDLIRYVAEDLTILEISEKVKLSPATVKKRLDHYNLKVPRKHIRYKLDVPFTQLVEEYNKGYSIPEIAIKYKMSPTYIKIRIRENGGIIRSKKEAQLLRYKREKMKTIL